jgi:hypothetical protein
VLLPCVGCGGTPSCASASQSVAPVLRSRQRTVNWYDGRAAPRPPRPPPNPLFGFAWPLLNALVTMTLSPTTIGHDQATPGTSAFHLTFLSGSQTAGSFVADSPLPSAPRNCGESAAPTGSATAARPPATNIIETVRMPGPPER